jgi:CHAT domain-containing protein/Flp pilus assembly protein TadD
MNPDKKNVQNNKSESLVKWATLARNFLSRRDEHFLQQAILEAKKIDEPEIINYLQAFADADRKEVKKLAEQLISNLNQSGRREEALTANLLYLHTRVSLAESFVNYPFEQQKQAREIGIQSCQQAIQIAQTLNDKPCQAIYSGVLAGGFTKSFQLHEAELFSNEALRLYRELSLQEPNVFNENIASILNNLGIAQSEMQKLTDAEDSFSEALRLYQQLALQKPDIFNIYVTELFNNLGIVQKNLGKLVEAEKSITKALQFYRELALHNPDIFIKNVAVILNNLGNLQKMSERLINAEISFTEALQIYRGLALQKPHIFNRYVAAILTNLGNLQRNQEKLPEAEKSFTEALRLYRNLALQEPDIFNQNVASTVNGLGIVQSERRKLTKAEKSFTEALRLYRELALEEPDIFNQNVALTLDGLGIAQSRMQKLAEAENSFTEALRLYRELDSHKPDVFRKYLADTLNNLGYLQVQQKRLNEAEENFETARGLIEDLRAKALTIDDRNRILQKSVNVYNNLLTCYIRTSDWEKALEIAERGKSRSLSDLLNLKSEDFQPKASSSDDLVIVKDLGQKYSDTIKESQQIESYEKYLSEQLSDIEIAIKQIKENNENDEDARQAFLQQIDEQKLPLEQEKQKVQNRRFVVQNELKSVLKEINRYDQDFPPKAKDIDVESIFEISKALNRTIVMFRLLLDSTAIIFVFPTGELYIKEIKGFGQNEMYELFVDKWAIPYQQWKKSHHQNLKEANFPVSQLPETEAKDWMILMEKTLDIIYKKLISHVHQILREKSPTKEILFIPNQSLALLPLHAASWKDKNGERRYLLEEFTISYCPSVSVFKRCQENEKVRTNKTLLVTNPTRDLIFSEKEVKFIKKIHQPSTNLRRKKASKSAVIKALRDDYSFTHFACHGFYYPENQFDSGLRMADKVIKLSEIINCNLQNNWLTTLSACETGMVDFASPTDEHFGLPLGFIFAGSTSIWASLWSVSDETTSILMQKAYDNLSKEEFRNNKPKALREAQLSMLRKFPHPYYWAGFQHFGI